jgi:hypothetical protein
VQTDVVHVSYNTPASSYEPLAEGEVEVAEDDGYSSLSAADLASILKWSQEISRDINLSTALQRLTAITMGTLLFLIYGVKPLTLSRCSDASGAQSAVVVLAREGGDYSVVTTMTPPESCQVYEYVVNTC